MSAVNSFAQKSSCCLLRSLTKNQRNSLLVQGSSNSLYDNTRSWQLPFHRRFGSRIEEQSQENKNRVFTERTCSYRQWPLVILFHFDQRMPVLLCSISSTIFQDLRSRYFIRRLRFFHHSSPRWAAATLSRYRSCSTIFQRTKWSQRTPALSTYDWRPRSIKRRSDWTLIVLTSSEPKARGWERSMNISSYRAYSK